MHNKCIQIHYISVWIYLYILFNAPDIIIFLSISVQRNEHKNINQIYFDLKACLSQYTSKFSNPKNPTNVFSEKQYNPFSFCYVNIISNTKVFFSSWKLFRYILYKKMRVKEFCLKKYLFQNNRTEIQFVKIWNFRYSENSIME